MCREELIDDKRLMPPNSRAVVAHEIHRRRENAAKQLYAPPKDAAPIEPDPARMGVGEHPLPGNDPPEVGDLDYHVERYLDRVLTVCALLVLFGLPALIAALLCGCSPQHLPPCEAQAGQMLQRLKDTPQPALATSITPGADVTLGQAVQNRLAIESSPSPSLPANSIVRLDRAWQPVSGVTLDGQGSTIANWFDATTRTIQARGELLGYFDLGTVTGDFQFTLKDATQAGYYKPGAPCYLWLLDGFMPKPDGTPGPGSMRTIRGVSSVKGAVINLIPGGPPLNKKLTAAKWFTNGLFVGNVKQGQQEFTVPLIGTADAAASPFKVGDWLVLTEGPSIANEGREEWHRVAEIDGMIVTLAWPAQRRYSAAVLAQAAPVVGVTLRNLTIDLPADKTIWTTQLNYFHNARLDNCTIRGNWAHVGSAFCTFTNCHFEGCALTACHDFTFSSCVFNTLWLEEASFNITCTGCVFNKSMSGNTGIERINLKACRLLAGLGNFIGLQAPGSTFDALTLDATAYIGGDGVTIRNCRGAIVLGKGSGVVLDSPGAKVQAGTWIVIP